MPAWVDARCSCLGRRSAHRVVSFPDRQNVFAIGMSATFAFSVFQSGGTYSAQSSLKYCTHTTFLPGSADFHAVSSAWVRHLADSTGGRVVHRSSWHSSFCILFLHYSTPTHPRILTSRPAAMPPIGFLGSGSSTFSGGELLCLSWVLDRCTCQKRQRV